MSIKALTFVNTSMVVIEPLSYNDEPYIIQSSTINEYIARYACVYQALSKVEGPIPYEQ